MSSTHVHFPFLYCLLWFATSLEAITGPVLFLTDFGNADDSVAICKGVMLAVEPKLQIIDITHEVPPFSIADGARLLAGTAPYYPSGTVFVAVVDPGVGGNRKPMVAMSKKRQLFVLPDNGLITGILDRDGLEGAREITNGSWMLDPNVSPTFHGRDIFSPVAARLAKGEAWEQVGPEISNPVRLERIVARIDGKGVSGEVIGIEAPYGNLITNIDGGLFRQLGYAHGDKVRCRLGRKEEIFPLASTFSDVPLKKPLLYLDSRGQLAFAIHRGNFAKTHRITAGTKIFISKKAIAALKRSQPP